MRQMAKGLRGDKVRWTHLLFQTLFATMYVSGCKNAPGMLV